MSKLTKNQKLAAEKIEAGKAYSLKEAAQLVKEITFTKFDASLDIDVRLGVDPRKANQMVRGVVSLPHGTGKVTRVLVLCTPDAEAAAKEAGADYVGLDEYIEKIKGGWTDIDVIITMPSIMGKIGALGRVLGPRGLMPNPKSGTVTMDVAKAVKEVKQGKIDFKVDKSGIVHTSIGKVSFSADQIRDNAKEFISTLNKLKPTWPRSFMPQNQNMRDLVAKMKLLPNEAFTRDARIVFLDDSIVRGTQLKDNVVKLRECGVKEVHIRIACPPLIYPCCFLNFSTSRSTFDLFARRVIRDLEGTSELTDEILKPYSDPDSEKYKEMVRVMCQHLQLDSLQFQRLDDLVKAIGLPKEQLCTHCWDNSSYME